MMPVNLLIRHKFLDTAELPKTTVPTQEVAYLDMEDATQMQRLPEHQLLMLQDH